MRVAVLREPRDLVIEERPTPEPAPGQVLVRVSAVGVCGSDTHYFDHGRIGPFVVEAPLVLGHEAAGVVAAVGDGVTGPRVGQRVSIEPGVPDFTCPQCLAGRYNLCAGMRFFATPPIDGAFAEYVTVHPAFAHPVPDTISDDAAALLEPLSVAVWACEKARVGPGDRVLVTGAGPIGLLALQTALAFGAAGVTVRDVNPDRLAVARSLGAARTVDAREPGTDPDEPAPTVLLECSGAAAAATAGLAALDRAGRAVLIGMGSDDLPLPVSVIQARELTITGTFRYANTWPTAIDLAASGRVDLDALVTGHYDLADAGLALTAARDVPGSVKVIVRPQRA
ncbi:NAD(P)-dependent alcohol dehydrogenase [Jidongwangia harbinensis]|uniref:NAD(P)-dependent alcohol dehydrogenase n=1 Tax=Jidongwangia harbinensis TaxID=2878561 RepID=UPI001CD9D4F2|nr:NAD(P)-dependent alcohol dehydrogenase [Jidongwangia harbinensis]MCA2218816.1 NAD(P)-dependent alcohol dehydrogenase [Jidongwangia harbinensis]